MLVLRREIAYRGTLPSGIKSVCHVNDTPVPLKLLRAIGGVLFDINAQVFQWGGGIIHSVCVDHIMTPSCWP